MDVQLLKDYGRAKRNRLLIDWNLKWKGRGKGKGGKGEERGGKLCNYLPRGWVQVYMAWSLGHRFPVWAISCLCVFLLFNSAQILRVKQPLFI